MIAPSAATDLWDYLVVGNVVAPGAVRLSGNDLTIGWDIQSPTGMAGGITRRIGEPVKQFDAEFELSDERNVMGLCEFDAWDDFQKLLESSVPQGIGKKPRALDVYHPDLARNRITAATIGSIGGLVLDGRGGGKIKVHFIEYRPPKALAPIALTKTAGDRAIEGDIAILKLKQDEFKKL